jgi:hypothetical protein
VLDPAPASVERIEEVRNIADRVDARRAGLERSLTTMPFSSARPLPARNSTFGTTPTPTTARSASTRSPLLVST